MRITCIKITDVSHTDTKTLLTPLDTENNTSITLKGENGQ